MKRKQMVLVTLAAVAAALVGGMLGGWLFTPVPVQAQEEASELRTISVSNLQLVDEEGRVVGELSANGGEPMLWLEDGDGGYIDLITGGGEASCRAFVDSDISAIIGTVGMMLMDPNGASVECSYDKNGWGLKYFDSKGLYRSVLHQDALVFSNGGDTAQAMLGLVDNEGSLAFFDNSGRTIWAAP